MEKEWNLYVICGGAFYSRVIDGIEERIVIWDARFPEILQSNSVPIIRHRGIECGQ